MRPALKGGFLILVVLASCWSSPLHALTIEISGNQRTTERHLKKLVRICHANLNQERIARHDDDALRTAEAKRQLRACLLKNRYLETVRIDHYDAEKIAVTVTDKWTFLVLPSYVQSEESVDNTAGLLLYDSNLGGVGHEIGLVYNRALENELNSYSMFYEIPNIDPAGRYDLDIILLNRDTRFYSYEEEDWTFRTREVFRFLWLRFNHHINSQFSWQYGYAPAYLAFSEGEYANGTRIQSTPSANLQTFNLGFVWDDTYHEYYYDRGSRLQLTWHQQFQRDDAESLEGALLLVSSFAFPTANRQTMQIGAHAGWRSQVRADNALRTGNGIGSRGIPADGAWGQGYANVGLDYQIPITSGRYGYWTAGPFLDLGYVWDALHHSRSEIAYTATGLASYVHLLTVNVPAVGLFYSFNDQYQNGFLSFYIGFTL